MKADGTKAVQAIQSSRVQQFLSKHRTERGKKYNFTSYAKPLGSYYVPDEKLDEFYDLYVDLVERQKVMPYYTEKPGQFSPIVIDIDLKYPLPSDPADDVSNKRYDQDFVVAIVTAYNTFLNKWLKMDDKESHCFLFERPAAYATDKNVKDGFHLVYPNITCPSALKLMAREFVIQKCADEFAALDTENTPGDIVDLAVIQRNNWFVYGSGKPGCDPYQLTKVLNSALEPVDFSHYTFKDLVKLLSVRGTTAANYKFREGMEEEFANAYEEYQDRAAGRGRSSNVPRREDSQSNIKNARQNKFNTCENLDFVRELVKILSPARADNYATWMQVGWCLHNVNTDLLPDWIEFSRKSAKFEEGACETAWDNMREEGLGMGSLVRWAKEDNLEAYEKVRSTDNQTLLENAAVSGGAHHAVAKVLYGMFRYQFVCLSRKFKAWIEYRGHRWHRTEDGYGLLCKLSNELYREFTRLAGQYSLIVARTTTDDDRDRNERKRMSLNKIATRLLDSSYKTNIMKEAYELFYVDGFEDRLDTNPHLIGFENGVYDLEKMEFRDGRPEDCLTLSTGGEYKPYDPEDANIRTVERVVAQLHRDDEIRDYMLKLMASFLCGQIKQQKFHIWTGNGCHAPGSKMLMWGGGIKKIEDIKVGDIMMGDDSTPRHVQKLWHGEQEMFRVVPVKGEPFVVNAGHKLPLKATNTICVSYNKKSSTYIVSWQESDPILIVQRRYERFRVCDYESRDAAQEAAEAKRARLHAEKTGTVVQRGDVFDVPIDWYLENKNRIGQRWYMLYRSPSFYEDYPVDLDPWLLGYWLGDGDKHNSNLTTADPEVVNAVRSIIRDYAMEIEIMPNREQSYRLVPTDGYTRRGKRYKGNFVYQKLKEIGVIAPGGFRKGSAGDNKHIPDDYKYNSRENRLQLLAGIIDSDGSYQLRSKQYEVTLKNEALFDDVIFIARSLGFAAYKYKVVKTCSNAKGGPKAGTYFRTQIYGVGLEEIPVKVERKAASTDRTVKRSALVTNFKLEPLGVGEYFGVQVDGNHRYLDENHVCQANSNGKSLLVEMFMSAFGQYSAVLPISLLTSKRSASNQATPELSRTKGRRFCVLQEPEDDVRINVGLMKELTGGDKIVSRDLFCPIVEFKPQFKMVLTCNRLPDIPSNDGGTWRRIRVVEFLSKFCDNPDPDNPYEFKVDLTLSSRMEELGQALMSILIPYYKKYCDEGLTEPAAVMHYTLEYQKRCDVYLEFVNNYIVATEDRRDILRLSEIYQSFKEWFKQNEADLSKLPNSKDLREYINVKIAKGSHNAWKGYRLKALGEEEISDDEE